MNTLEYVPPIPPTHFAELSLNFDHDFPIEDVSRILGLEPKEALRQSQTRINPITQKHNAGYWAIETEPVSSFDIEPSLLEAEKFLTAHSSGLQQVLQQYAPCNFLLRIRVIVHQEDEYPAIRFEPELLQRLSAFHVAIDIEIETDFIDK